MRKRIIPLIFGSLFIFCASTNLFGQTSKSYRIGISVWTGYPASVKGFKESLRQGGFIDGKNVTYLYRKSGPDKSKQRSIAQELKTAKVDLVYTLTTPGTTIIKEILSPGTPIVFSIVTYPADSGLIESFEYSGNNLVGTSNYVPLAHYVSVLKTILPHVKTVAIFHRKDEPNSKIQAANMIRLFKKAGISTIDLEPDSMEQVRSMAMGVIGKVDVFMTTTDTLMQGGGEKILIEISLGKKVPILSSNKAGIEQGSTFGPVADFYTLGKMSGEMAVKILKENISPARLQSKLQDPPLIMINRESANALKIKIPEGRLQNVRYVD